MALLGPFEVGFPVRFFSGGDTVKEAFFKHIQEFERVYGLLNSLDAGKVSADEVTGRIDAHINSTNPHPNWTPDWSNLRLSDLVGDLDGSRISGTISAAKIMGLLSNARISSENVEGLDDRINSRLNQGVDARIKDLIPENSGQITFPNGLIVKWGYTTSSSANGGHVTFPTPFPSACNLVVGCTYVNDGQTEGAYYGGSYNAFFVNAWNKNGFGFGSHVENLEFKGCCWVAFGK